MIAGWVLSGVRRGSNHRMLCGRSFLTLWGFNRLEAGLWIRNGYREPVVCGDPEIVVVDERGSAGERLIQVSLKNVILLFFSSWAGYLDGRSNQFKNNIGFMHATWKQHQNICPKWKKKRPWKVKMPLLHHNYQELVSIYRTFKFLLVSILT